jgi:hypothetical protein
VSRGLRFDIWQRYILEVRREQHQWVAYEVGEGKFRLRPDVLLPVDAAPDDLDMHLGDVLSHLWSAGKTIRRLPLR